MFALLRVGAVVVVFDGEAVAPGISLGAVIVDA